MTPVSPKASWPHPFFLQSHRAQYGFLMWLPTVHFHSEITLYKTVLGGPPYRAALTFKVNQLQSHQQHRFHWNTPTARPVDSQWGLTTYHLKSRMCPFSTCIQIVVLCPPCFHGVHRHLKKTQTLVPSPSLSSIALLCNWVFGNTLPLQLVQ